MTACKAKAGAFSFQELQTIPDKMHVVNLVWGLAKLICTLGSACIGSCRNMCVSHLQQSSVQLLSSVNNSQGTGKTQVWQGKSSNNLHDMPTLVHSSSLTL